MSQTFKPCVLVPVYRHAHLLQPLLTRISTHQVAVLLVNDGGDANETDMLRTLARRFDCLLVEQHPNGGKGSAVMLGIRHAAAAGYSHVLQIDADGQHDVGDIPRFLALAEDMPAAVITGVPVYDESVPKHRFYGRYATHVLVWLETLSLEITDSMCGFRVYPVSSTLTVAQHPGLGRRMDFDTEILVRLYWHGLRVVSVATRVIYPEGGVSNFNLWRDNVAMTWMHIRLILGMLWRSPQLLYWHWSRRGQAAVSVARLPDSQAGDSNE